MSALPKLLEIIRKNARSGTWSSGVNLARAGAVALESESADEVVVRVRSGGRPVPATAVLYPTMEEWECDCPSRVSPCEHVAAAAIVLAQGGAEEGAAKPVARVAEAWARVVYRFARADGGLRVTRALARADGTQTPLEGTLSGLLSRPQAAAELQTEQADLQADLLLETGGRGVLPATKLDALLRVLTGSRQVLLDGRPMIVSDEEVLPRATIADRGEDVVVTIARDPRVTEVPSVGVAVCGDELHRLGEIELAGGWLQNLPIVRTYSPRQLGEVTTKLLPDLSRRMVVDVQSTRLPKVARGLSPRLVLDLSHVGASLSVLPTLVYGTPPCVRIDDGKMTYLRGPVPVRDEEAERRLVHSLRDELNLVPGRRATFDGPEAVRFAQSLERWRGEIKGEAARLVGKKTRLEPRLALTTGGADGAGGAAEVRFALSFNVAGDDEGSATRSVDATAVIRAWQEGLGLVPLDGGGWAPLPAGWLEKHGHTVADLLAARESDGRVATHALPALGALCDALEHPPPPGLDRLAPLLEGFERIPEAPLPPDLTATLRPYQRQGVSWLAFLRSARLGGILADDMGLGKTLQTLCAFEGGGKAKALVVAPTSVLHNWDAELRRFRPSLRVALYHGAGRQLDESADVVITSYAILRLEAERLAARRWAMVVLDEAQAIKNPDSQVARAAYALNADFRLALTGTPIENRLEELWSLLHFTNRGLLGGRRDFDDRFARPIASGEQGVAGRLRQRIRPFVLRRMKRDVAPELPPRTESVLHVALDERERAVYDAVRAATQAEVLRALGEGGGIMKALEALLRLRQAACHSALLPGQEARSSSKVEALIEALSTAVADGHKALVFSQWTSLLDLLEPALGAADIGFVRLDGSTRDRGEVATRFQSADGPPVMLISLKAGGAGLNLTAADHVFLFDPWWNPAVEAQAADRAHRIGQDRPVMVYRLVALATVEEKILALQEKKRALYDAALGDAGAAAGLTREDLLALLA